MTLRTILFAALLAISGAAISANPPPSATTGVGPGSHHMGPCEKDPSQCQADAAKFDNWCTANADKCTALKAWAVKRAEYCQANAQKCKERMQKMHEHMKKYCASNPDDEHCQKMNGKGDQGDMGGDMPPPPGA
jgi:hypothetical protein